MKAFISKRASRAADRIDARWHESADDPGIFARELLESFHRFEELAGEDARIDARWHESADDPGIFARELLEAVERLETTSGIGAPFPTQRHPSLKRLLLPKSRCHIYFEIDDANQTIQILHIWDARRERGPKM